MLPTTRSIMAAISRCSKPIEGESRHVRSSNPRRLELRPEGDDQQHAKGWYPVHDPTKRFEARGVDPMRILEDHQHRIVTRQGLDLRNERFERFLPPLLRCQFERRITSIVRQRQHLGKQCRILRVRSKLCASRASSLSSFACAVSSCANPAARSIWLMIG